MNALQRRRFARAMVATETAGALWVRAQGLSGALCGVPLVEAAPDVAELEQFERDTRHDLARSIGPSLFRSSCKGILRALKRWRAAQTQASGSTSPTQADDTCHTRSG